MDLNRVLDSWETRDEGKFPAREEKLGAVER